MPLKSSYITVRIGISQAYPSPNAYCQSRTDASDYGKCYGIIDNKAIFVQADTSTYPVGSLPCELEGTCIRYTSVTTVRVITTLFDYSNKQAIVQNVCSRSHSNLDFAGLIAYWRAHIFPAFSTESLTNAYSWILPEFNYENLSWPIYDPVRNWKAYYNPYKIPIGRVFMLKWQGFIFTPVLYLTSYEEINNNIWYLGDVSVVYAYEASPLAIIPLDYDREYLPYQELRGAFGYSYNGVDQPGWNADDIISVSKELFPDRAWAVFDDRTHTLYLYNLTPDYVPDWLVEKLAPISMKVLKQPADSSAPKAWLDELNRINAYEAPLSVEV